MKKPKPESVGMDWPASKIEMWPVERIVPYPHNPRTHSEEQIKLIAASMQNDGVIAPILVDEAGVIIYGHGRREAAIENGFESYPVCVARGWTEEKKRAVRIKDNSLALLSGWDQSLLKGEITSLKTSGYDVELLGFGDVELINFEVLPGLASDQRAPTVGNLADRFGIAPFTTLNAREGWWQDRKRGWLALGIRSEVGRGENLLKFSDTINQPDPVKRAARKSARVFGQDMLEGEGVTLKRRTRKSTKNGEIRARAAADGIS